MKAPTAALLLTIAASATTGNGVAAGATPALAAAADEAGIAPFIARYQADWKGISIGTSDIQLTRGVEPGQYLYTWTITPPRRFFALPTTTIWCSRAG